MESLTKTHSEVVKAVAKAQCIAQAEANSWLKTTEELEQVKENLKNTKDLCDKKMLSDVDRTFEEMMASKEMDELIEKRLVNFLATPKGRVINALGFTMKYIKPIVMDIVKGMNQDSASLFKEIYQKNNN